jgi:hypothetical protein
MMSDYKNDNEQIKKYHYLKYIGVDNMRYEEIALYRFVNDYPIYC